MFGRSRTIPFMLAGLAFNVLDNPLSRMCCGQKANAGPDLRFAEDPQVTVTVSPGDCWIFSHMPKSGGFTLQTMLKHYSKSHQVVLGRYDTDEWLEGTQTAKSYLNSGYTLIGGGYTDGLRPHGGRDCKWFTMFRHPISRLVSAYFYCKESPTDQLCATGVLDARETDFHTFALHWTNFGLRQFAQAFVTQPEVLADEFDNGLCPPDASNNACPGWFRIKQYFEQQPNIAGDLAGWAPGTDPLPDLAMYRMLKPVQDMLTSNYTAVGILEHWDASMLLFNQALKLPRWRWDRAFSRIGKLNSNSKYHFEAKTVLQNAWYDPEIRRLLWLDILLYDHAVALFHRQVEEYNVL